MGKQNWLFERGENGELLPKKVFVKALNEDVLLTPLTWGEWKKIRNNVLLAATGGKLETNQEEDIEVLVKHCKSPVFTIEEARLLKPFVVEAIVNAIYENSGLVAEKTEETVGVDGGVPK